MADETAIHDLGYRPYEGVREGARGAWIAIYGQGFRGLFGLGRAARAKKIIPLFVVVVTLLQVLGNLFASSATQGQLPIRYGSIYGGSVLLYALFIAAQAPELLSRDQQHRILPLVLTRATTRNGYASARLAAIISAQFALVFGCFFLLYIGQIGLATDPAKAFRDVGDNIFPVLGLSVVTAITLGGVGAGISAWTPRRAYATAAIMGFFLVLAAVASGFDDLTGLSSRSAELIDPIRTLRMMSMLFFDEQTRGMEENPPMDVEVYVALALAFGVAGSLLVFWRYRRLTT